MQVTIVGGARPNFMKIAPLIRAIKEKNLFGYRLVHTGQHYDEKLSDVFFKELLIPPPDVNLGVGSGSQATQTGNIMIAFEKDLEINPSDLVIVVGDVNSTMACSVVARKMGVPVAHIEAGIRSFDWSMPEEVNRVVTDALASWYFTTTEWATENLKRSGVDSNKIFLVGNIMIDSLTWALPQLKPSGISFPPRSGYFVLTLHRPSNVDSKGQLDRIIQAIIDSAGDHQVIFTVHPRTEKNLDRKFLEHPNLTCTPPLGYFEFISLMKGAKGMITDSGGVQEETTFLGIPCLTLRNNTERPETVSVGTNELIGEDLGKLKDALQRIASGVKKQGAIPALWDGQTAPRIVRQLDSILRSMR